MSSPSRNISFS